MTEITYHIVESSLHSCVEIVKRTTCHSKGLGALIPPSSSSKDETILSIPYRSTLLPFAGVAFRNKAAARQYAETILPSISTANH